MPDRLPWQGACLATRHLGRTQISPTCRHFASSYCCCTFCVCVQLQVDLAGRVLLPPAGRLLQAAQRWQLVAHNNDLLAASDTASARFRNSD